MDIFIRDVKSNPDLYRAHGKVPGVIYGFNVSSTPIYVVEKDLLRLVKEHEGGLLQVRIFADEHTQNFKVMQCILRDIQVHPLTEKIIHFDLYVPSLEKVITAKVPLEFIKEAPAVKKGGVLNIGLHELEVKALPTNIPEKIFVDLSVLTELEQTIYVKDLSLPKGVEVLLELSTPIVSIVSEEAAATATPNEENQSIVS